MSVLDRVGKLVRSEWNARRPHLGGSRADGKGTAKNDPRDARAAAASAPLRRPAVVDFDGALRVLELTGQPTLDEVRARYAELARRYHPKTLSEKADEAHAARVVLEALTDALELLEVHLLPLPTGPAAAEAGGR